MLKCKIFVFYFWESVSLALPTLQIHPIELARKMYLSFELLAKALLKAVWLFEISSLFNNLVHY